MYRKTLLDLVIRTSIKRTINAKNMEGQTFKGRISTNAKGFGFFMSEDLEDDIFIQPGKLGSALNGDEVKVKIVAKNDAGPLGEVVEILDRAHGKYVGTLDATSGRNFVISDDKKSYVDFFVPGRFLSDAEQGHKVVVELVEWKEGD